MLKFAKFLEISSQCERANLPSKLQNLSRFTLEIRSKCDIQQSLLVDPKFSCQNLEMYIVVYLVLQCK